MAQIHEVFTNEKEINYQSKLKLAVAIWKKLPLARTIEDIEFLNKFASEHPDFFEQLVGDT